MTHPWSAPPKPAQPSPATDQQADIARVREELARTSWPRRILNFCINAPRWAVSAAISKVFYTFMRWKVKSFYPRWNRFLQWKKAKKNVIAMKIQGYKFISPDDFLKEFPPKPGHKKCSYGRGWGTMQLPNGRKKIWFCECVLKQYRESGKKYALPEEWQ
jgi:hypothetical protein